MATNNTIKVTGAKELRKEIRKLQSTELKNEMKKANKEAAEIVAKEARNYTVPVRSGALKASIRALGSQTKGQVAAGLGKTKNYAGIIHFGNPHRNIRPQPYLYEAQDRRINEVFRNYEDSINKIAKKISTR